MQVSIAALAIVYGAAPAGADAARVLEIMTTSLRPAARKSGNTACKQADRTESMHLHQRMKLRHRGFRHRAPAAGRPRIADHNRRRPEVVTCRFHHGGNGAVVVNCRLICMCDSAGLRNLCDYFGCRSLVAPIVDGDSGATARQPAAIARPTPREPPVTSATRPKSELCPSIGSPSTRLWSSLRSNPPISPYA